MIIVHVNIKNGVTLEDTQLYAIDPYKVVWMKSYGSGNLAHILYCRNTDRREPCDDLWLTETYAAMLTTLQGLFMDMNEYTVYTKFVAGHGIGDWTEQEIQLYNDFFVEDITSINEHDDPIVIRYNGTPTEVSCLRYCEGAFKREKIYIEPVVVTTTTEEVVVTTTAEEVTTTTEEPVTTTSTTWEGCFEWIITNLDEQIPAVFRIFPCDNECQEDYVMVEFGSPVVGCYCYEPVIVFGESYILTKGRSCEPEVTTTTTEENVPTTTEEEVVSTTTEENVATTTEEPFTTTTSEIQVPSDIRLKENVIPTGNKIGIFNEYVWDWNDEAIRLGLDKYPAKGVIAQIVMKTNPEAVSIAEDGFYRVDLSKIS